MVTRRSLPGVPRRSTASLFFKLLFDALLAGYTEVKNQLKLSFFFMNIKFDELLSEIGNVLQKRKVYRNHVSIIAQSVQFFLHSHNVTKQRNVTT